MEIQTQKLNLNRNQFQELKIYFFIARKEKIEINPEMVQITLAYTLEDAFLRAKKETPNLNIYYKGQSCSVKELLAKIQLEQVITSPSEPQPAKTSKEQFKMHLLLAANELVKDEKDQKVLKDILEKI